MTSQATDQLVDGEKLLNNYADACLANTTKFTNQGEQTSLATRSKNIERS
jgi:hypothetical protein